MPIHPAYGQVTALLAAVFILIAGNGLITTLVPLRAAIEHFSPLELGLLGSAYFAGMFVGCLATPRMVARAGHIRAFAALAAVATASALAHAMVIEPVSWICFRAVTGFCFAGLYATIESWFHDKADNVVRGRILAVYQIVNYAGSAIGQQAIRLTAPTSFALFSLAAMAMALAVLPLAFTRSDPPNPPPAARLRLLWLYRVSPVAVLGTMTAGAANGTFWQLAPVFGTMIGLNPGEIASLLTATIAGAAVVQWQIGKFADRRDRRYVILATMVIGVATEILMVFFARDNYWLLLLLTAILGAAILALYPLASSHAADLAGRENMVEVSTGLLLAYTIGAVAGPTVAAVLMARIEPEALFIQNAVIHGALAAFVLWRLWQRPGRREDAA